MIDEIRLKEVVAEDVDLDKLNSLLSHVGAELNISCAGESGDRRRIKIVYDTAVVRRRAKREAGRKPIKTGLYYSIGDVKEKVKSEGLESVLNDLNISESTYYRRMRYYKHNHIDDSELFD